MSDEDLKGQVDTYATLLREAVNEQRRRKQVVYSAAEEEYISARDKLRSLSNFSVRSMLEASPFQFSIVSRNF